MINILKKDLIKLHEIHENFIKQKNVRKKN
jgi:hypothetical protein